MGPRPQARIQRSPTRGSTYARAPRTRRSSDRSSTRYRFALKSAEEDPINSETNVFDTRTPTRHPAFAVKGTTMLGSSSLVTSARRESSAANERQGTSRNVKERQRTSRNVNERQRTSTNVNEAPTHRLLAAFHAETSKPRITRRSSLREIRDASHSSGRRTHPS